MRIIELSYDNDDDYYEDDVDEYNDDEVLK